MHSPLGRSVSSRIQSNLDDQIEFFIGWPLPIFSSILTIELVLEILNTDEVYRLLKVSELYDVLSQFFYEFQKLEITSDALFYQKFNLSLLIQLYGIAWHAFRII